MLGRWSRTAKICCWSLRIYAKEVLKGWAVKTAFIADELLHFWIANNNYKWTNYPCEFRARFDTSDDARALVDGEFEKIVVVQIEEPVDDEDFVFQSQQVSRGGPFDSKFPFCTSQCATKH